MGTSKTAVIAAKPNGFPLPLPSPVYVEKLSGCGSVSRTDIPCDQTQDQTKKRADKATDDAAITWLDKFHKPILSSLVDLIRCVDVKGRLCYYQCPAQVISKG